MAITDSHLPKFKVQTKPHTHKFMAYVPTSMKKDFNGQQTRLTPLQTTGYTSNYRSTEKSVISTADEKSLNKEAILEAMNETEFDKTWYRQQNL